MDKGTHKGGGYTFDVLRSVILGAYIRHWGMPELKIDLTKSRDDSSRVEIHFFPATNDQDVARFATVGMCLAKRETGAEICIEWMMALPYNLGGESTDRVFTYFADLIANHLVNAKDSNTPRVMQESHIAPQLWSTKAILIDELRGENESLEAIPLNSKKIEVQWVIPVTQEEAKLILEKGIDAFDEVEATSDYSIIDVNRVSFF